jgi:hypothetical protein
MRARMVVASGTSLTDRGEDWAFSATAAVPSLGENLTVVNASTYRTTQTQAETLESLRWWVWAPFLVAPPPPSFFSYTYTLWLTPLQMPQKVTITPALLH